jgi:hypothetical protein
MGENDVHQKREYTLEQVSMCVCLGMIIKIKDYIVGIVVYGEQLASELVSSALKVNLNPSLILNPSL